MTLSTMPKIPRLGLNRTWNLLKPDRECAVEEKVDGSQVSWLLDDSGPLPNLLVYGRRLSVDLDEPPKPYAPMIKPLRQSLEQGLLEPGLVYRGEALGDLQSYTLSYGRAPMNNGFIYDIQDTDGYYLSDPHKRELAARAGV